MKQAGRASFLGWIFAIVVAGALSVGALVAYQQMEDAFEMQLERRLKSYAASGAASLSIVGLEGIRDEQDELAKLYRTRLQALQQGAGVRRVAVLRRDGTLILDTSDGAKDRRDSVLAQDANELEACFEQGPVVTVEYFDDDGLMFRNGFAPVRDRDGVVGDFAVAVELEADYVSQLETLRLILLLTVIGVFGVTLAVALVVVARWRGVQKDLETQRQLAEMAQFSAGMAHQIKNPLAALRGYVELLERGLKDKMQRDIASKLISEIGALDRVVREFLQFARGSKGSVEKLSLKAALAPVLEAALAANPSIELIASLPEIELEQDMTAIREALTNVVVNAAQELGDGGKLEITASESGEKVSVVVRDNGPGIPEHVREQMFVPFVTGKADGTGLGLPIARRLLRDADGNLALTETGESGTVFTATFAKKKD
ncbi:ATP-binding protein [Planctomycetota bacterium]|nr:ATP-binding protein [Planctomycetota bacterium]